MSLLDGGLQAQIGTDPDLIEICLDGALTEITSTNVNGRIEKSETEHSVKGFYDTWQDKLITNPSERVAVILAYGLAYQPKPQDKITFGNEMNYVKAVEIDPAHATYVLRLTPTK